MAQDFRTLLKEIDREGDSERFFDIITIGDWFHLDIQASPLHDCIPREMHDDPDKYEAFQVNLSTTRGAISYGSRGAWKDLQHRDWAGYFSAYQPAMLIGREVPADTVQRIYEDLLEYAENNT